MSSIVFDCVTKKFHLGRAANIAVDDVSLMVGDGEFAAVVGPSGCGKTTLLRMAAGLEYPDAGAVNVGGVVVSGPGIERAVVFQNLALMPWKSVRGNIEFGLKCKGVPRAERRDILDHYVALMGLRGHENAYPHQLSGGMQQRVALARSYAVRPKVLLMDEPFGALDAQTRSVMQEELRRISNEEKRTVFFITHDAAEAVYLADRVVIMSARPGRILDVLDVARIRTEENWNERSSADIAASKRFNEMKSYIWDVLRSEGTIKSDGVVKAAGELAMPEAAGEL